MWEVRNSEEPKTTAWLSCLPNCGMLVSQLGQKEKMLRCIDV